jgi:hypothetical protein
MLTRTIQKHSYYYFREKFLNEELEFAKAPYIPGERLDTYS